MQGETIHTDLQSHFRALSVPQALIELQNRPEWARWLTWHCVHCGCFQKCTRTGQQHIANEHPQILMSSTHKIYQPWIAQVRSPRMYCNKIFKHSHQCSPLFQLASLFATQDMDLPQRSATICLHCAQILTTDAQLNEHLRNDHPRYSCIRDTVRGQPQCRHCGTDFKEIWELQRHINRGSCNCIDYLADQQGVLRKEEAMLESLLWGTGVFSSTAPTTRCCSPSPAQCVAKVYREPLA